MQRAVELRHRGAGNCLRHDAGILRAERDCQSPRHGHAGQALARLRHRPVRGCRRQGRQADSVLAGGPRYRLPLRRRGCRRHPAPASRAVAATGSPAGPEAGIRRHRDAAGAGAGADGAARRAGRRRRVAPTEQQLGKRMHALQSRHAAHRRTRIQPRFAQAAAGDAVRRTRPAGGGEDARRASRPPTRKHWKRSPTSTSCRA